MIMEALLNDTTFWVLISFVIFIGIFIRYGKARILSMIDGRITAIRNELEMAERLRVEAQELLADYQRKQKDAAAEAEAIVADAHRHADTLRRQAEEDLQVTIARRERQLEERLKRIEEQARQDIETYTARISINAARTILAQSIDAKSDKTLIDETLNHLPKNLN